MDIVDAHHHFWDLDNNDHPWLAPGVSIPFRYGDYDAIKKNYLPSDLRQDAGEFNVIDSVYVEAEWDPDDPIGETRWVHGIHQEFGLPSAIVAQAWLDSDDAGTVLAAQADFPLVRSVRHKPTGAATIGEFQAGKRSTMGDSGWRSGFELLAKHSLHFDLQTPYWHLAEAHQLASDFPNTLIILNHTGLPADRSAAGLSQWRDSMVQLAAAPNVRVKISGLGQHDKPWTVEANQDIVLFVINTFGAQRCMFASNFPVDGLCGDYSTIYAGFVQIVAHLPPEDQRRLFVETAKEVYSI